MSAWLRRVATDAGVDADMLSDAELCLNEAAANIILYAHDDPNRHPILVELEAAERTVRMTIVDDGRPFNPLEATEAAPAPSLDDSREGGFGIHLMRSFSTDIRYRRENSHNVLTLTFESGHGSESPAPGGH